MELEFAVAPAEAGQRLDHALQVRYPGFSRSRLQDWIRQGRVRVGGRKEKPSFALRAGERVTVEPAAPPPLRAEPEALPVEILYEDAAVVAVNKPAGLTVHAGAGNHSGTLANRLVHHFRSLSSVGGDLRPGIVHRLDKDTSGVMLVARTDAAHRALAAQFAGREVEKIYLALVHGAVGASSGRIDTPIARDPVRRTRMAARPGHGRAALTEYRVLRRWLGLSLLEVRIGTGRTHQIRVHLSSAGHPVAGDRLYGAPPSPGLGRQFLHAHSIRFVSPATGQPVTVRSPLPADLESWLTGLGPPPAGTGGTGARRGRL